MSWGSYWNKWKCGWGKYIPKTWLRAGAVLISKEKDAKTLINSDKSIYWMGKIFCIIAQRMTTYLQQNNLSFGLLSVLLGASDHCKPGQELFPGSTVLCHNTRVLHISAKGIKTWCTISPLGLTLVMEPISRASRWVVGGENVYSLDSDYLLSMPIWMTWPPLPQPWHTSRDCWKNLIRT